MALKNASHCIITFGTAWIYRFSETDEIVANCHKIPQKKFAKELLSVNQISESIQNIISFLTSINPEITVIFTISPVRHLKDGFVENSQSKAHLIAAINVISKDKNIFYFPSYEIMMDELRDYRFYGEDMIHPNQIGIQYIWEKFINTWFFEETIPIMHEIEVIQKAILHKPFNENSEKHQAFLENLEGKKRKIQERLPFIYF